MHKMRRLLTALLALTFGVGVAYAALPVPDPGLRTVDAAGFANAINLDQHNTAAGQVVTTTTQATGFALGGAALTEFTTVPSSGAATLPLCVPGMRFSVSNGGANTLTIFTAVGEPSPNKINATAGATGVTLAAASNMVLWCTGTGQWYKITGN